MQIPVDLDIPKGCLVLVDRDPSKYVTLTRNGKKVSAHRYLYEKANGPIPKEAHVHHICGVPGCFNLAHLELVTPSQHRKRHISDGVRIGRSSWKRKLVKDKAKRELDKPKTGA